MKVLVACEESQEVCKAFRELGHEAYSCDIQEPSGGHPEWHILGDALEAVKGGSVTTMDGQVHAVGKWDLLIAHPPCTYLTNAGARHIWKGGQLQPDRVQKGILARDLFMRFWDADIPRVVIENPVPSKIFCLPEYSQIVQPFQFGHAVTKKTCLWERGVFPLKPTNIVEPVKGRKMVLRNGIVRYSCWEMDCGGSKEERAKARSKTFPGIAKAMAEQWGRRCERRNDMTRDEIVTALRCCVSYDDNDCKLCPLQTNTECLIALKTAVVDLIENQQRHIEALMKAMVKWE